MSQGGSVSAALRLAGFRRLCRVAGGSRLVCRTGRGLRSGLRSLLFCSMSLQLGIVRVSKVVWVFSAKAHKQEDVPDPQRHDAHGSENLFLRIQITAQPEQDQTGRRQEN